MEQDRDAVLRCKMRRGMFPSEVAVLIELADGSTASAFIDREDVTLDKEPEGEEVVNGCVRVYLVEEKKGIALIDLPQPTVINGTRVRVLTDHLREVYPK